MDQKKKKRDIYYYLSAFMQVTSLHVPYTEIQVTPLLKHVHNLLLQNPLQLQ